MTEEVGAVDESRADAEEEDRRFEERQVPEESQDQAQAEHGLGRPGRCHIGRAVAQVLLLWRAAVERGSVRPEQRWIGIVVVGFARARPVLATRRPLPCDGGEGRGDVRASRYGRQVLGPRQLAVLPRRRSQLELLERTQVERSRPDPAARGADADALVSAGRGRRSLDRADEGGRRLWPVRADPVPEALDRAARRDLAHLVRRHGVDQAAVEILGQVYYRRACPLVVRTGPDFLELHQSAPL